MQQEVCVCKSPHLPPSPVTLCTSMLAQGIVVPRRPPRYTCIGAELTTMNLPPGRTTRNICHNTHASRVGQTRLSGLSTIQREQRMVRE